MKDILYPLRVLHGRIHEWRKGALPVYLERFRNPKAVYLVMTPDYRNLGDHAIAESEIDMLNQLEIPFIEYPFSRILQLSRDKLLHILNGRTILITGGGNLGTLWFHFEKLFRDIVSSNPKSTILFLPNTIYYEDSEWGQQELQKSIQIYNAHNRVLFYARERVSYEKMRVLFPQVKLVPDMVIRMNKCKSGIKRDGCIMCLRQDRERSRSDEFDGIVQSQVRVLFGDRVKQLDMIMPAPVSAPERDTVLEKQFEAFRRAELVITDRLHGMIFCAITGTPCIVIDSLSPKVRGSYEWIRDLPYIRFCENPNLISEVYRSIPCREWQYDNSKLLPMFETLKNDILVAAKR